MKTKTIKAVIRKKLDNWFKTITNSEVRELAEKNTIVTGGCIASMLLQEEVNDFDVYFRNEETAVAIAQYYVTQFTKNPPPRFKEYADGVEICVIHNKETGRVNIKVQSAGEAGENSVADDKYETLALESREQENYLDAAMENVEDDADKAVATDKDGNPFRPVYLSSNAITLSDKIQIVIRFIGEPDSIHENYDFVHCTNYYTSWESALVLRADALEALLTRELRYVGSRYPLCSIIRTRKFINRGWSINAGQFVKMAMQLNELNLLDLAVLEDQLTGVDVAYFQQIIKMLQDKEDITTAYVIEVIDRMF